MKQGKISLLLRLSSGLLCLASLIILTFPLVTLREGCGPDLSGCVTTNHSAFDLSKVGSAGIECFWIPYFLIVCLGFLLAGAFLRPIGWKIAGTVASALLLAPAFALFIEPDYLCLQAIAAMSVPILLMIAFALYAIAEILEIVRRPRSDS